MQDLIDYVIEILNIKSDSTFTFADIESELQKINDMGMYREYIRDNLNNYDLKFNTGFQKFIILTKRFERIEEDARLHDTYEKATSYAKVIADKVKQCRELVESSYCGFVNIHYNDQRYFEVHELWALYETCHTTDKVIELSRTNNLAEQIHEVYISKYKKKASYTALTDNQERVRKITLEAIK